MIGGVIKFEAAGPCDHRKSGGPVRCDARRCVAPLGSRRGAYVQNSKNGPPTVDRITPGSRRWQAQTLNVAASRALFARGFARRVRHPPH